jgi:hypothetical protein
MVTKVPIINAAFWVRCESGMRGMPRLLVTFEGVCANADDAFQLLVDRQSICAKGVASLFQIRAVYNASEHLGRYTCDGIRRCTVPLDRADQVCESVSRDVEDAGRMSPRSLGLRRRHRLVLKL